MKLLASVNAGFQACPNGWVELYIRGSSTRATWYASFEGDGPDATGANITLDAYGSKEIYVNQLVDVVVKQSDGTLYRQYTEGDAAPTEEIISQSFTGTDYVTAASAANKPTTLQAIADLWKTNAGAIDWKVLINGLPTTLLNAFGFGTGLVFNVKSPEYGAVGDGVTNDQTAIQAALAAAVAAGGGTVYFPKGTYLISTVLDWAPLVNILGAGMGVSIIRTSSASNASVLKFGTSGAHTAPLFVADIALDASVTNTGNVVTTAANSVLLDFYRVRFGFGGNSAGDQVRVTNGGKVRLEDCEFYTAGSGYATYIAGDCIYRGCRFSTVNTSYDRAFCRADAASASNGNHDFSQCIYSIDAVFSAPAGLYGVETVGANVKATVNGCHFRSAGSRLFNAGIQNAVAALVVATGNEFSGCTARYGGGASMATGSYLELEPYRRTASALTSFTIPDGVYINAYALTGTVPSFTLPTKLYPGQRLIIMAWNNTGAPWGANVGVSGGVEWGTIATNAAANAAVFMEFVATEFSSGTVVWTAIQDKTGSA